MALNEGLPLLEDAVLLHELNHRINNEFASAISVVSRAAARSSNNAVKLALTNVTELLHRYAEVHRALQVPEPNTTIDVAASRRNTTSAGRLGLVEPPSPVSFGSPV